MTFYPMHATRLCGAPGDSSYRVEPGDKRAMLRYRPPRLIIGRYSDARPAVSKTKSTAPLPIALYDVDLGGVECFVDDVCAEIFCDLWDLAAKCGGQGASLMFPLCNLQGR
jgi:hypothetical protein